MQTREDWSTSEARQAERHQANQRGEEEDTIVQELPIVLSQQLAQTLYLMQSPLRSEATRIIKQCRAEPSRNKQILASTM